MTNDIEVSVYCLTYNHEKYIRQTLEGFVKQKTSFKYEVIVHDDASSDDTVTIIKEYAEKYPEIIIPIFQSVNQRSQNVSILREFIAPIVRNTKYYAVCEGDDYWTDAEKLQRQYDYMETHTECAMCVHNTNYISENGKDLHQCFNSEKCDKNYSIDEIIRAGGGGLFHTSSFFWRKNDGISVPVGFSIKGIGDYSRAIYLASKGYVHYIGRTMSSYRQGSINSWTSRHSKDKEKSINHYNNVIEGLIKINSSTNKQYELAISDAICNAQYAICIFKGEYNKIFMDKKLLNIFVHKPLKDKIMVLISILRK